jgi:hypothetical protein
MNNPTPAERIAAAAAARAAAFQEWKTARADKLTFGRLCCPVEVAARRKLETADCNLNRITGQTARRANENRTK